MRDSSSVCPRVQRWGTINVDLIPSPCRTACLETGAGLASYMSVCGSPRKAELILQVGTLRCHQAKEHQGFGWGWQVLVDNHFHSYAQSLNPGTVLQTLRALSDSLPPTCVLIVLRDPLEKLVTFIFTHEEIEPLIGYVAC